MDVAALLGYVRATWPYFNASLRAQPNHLLLFPGDMAMDLPRPRMQPPLSPEVDASQVRASDGLGRPWMTSDSNPMHAKRRDPHDTLSRSHLLVIRRSASYLAKTWCFHRHMISREGRRRMIAAAARRRRRGGGDDDHPASQIASSSRSRSRARPGGPL